MLVLEEEMPQTQGLIVEAPSSCKEPKLVGAKINISKEETEGDSACCGAGDLDVGAEEIFQGTEGHCAWNAKALAALRPEMYRSRRELKATRGNPERDLGSAEQERQTVNKNKKKIRQKENEIHCNTPQLQHQRARFGKDLELQGLKQGLGEKSANLRLNELLQAREQLLNLNSKDLQRECVKLKQQPGLGNKICPEKVEMHQYWGK
ncbi:LOW QUALITY PROTEIN: coiled-coil domain-containing protein 160 [Pluvialis apricaria]